MTQPSDNRAAAPAVASVSPERAAFLEQVRSALSRVYHDVNNPLAIISGNAQFMLELGRAMELDEDLMQPLRDIEEASQRVAESLKELTRLRETVKQHLDESGA